MSLRLRIVAVSALLMVFGLLAIAGFVPEERRKASWLIPDSGVRLGLDLQGGIHMVISPDLKVAEELELEQQRVSLEGDLADEKLTPSRIVIDGDAILLQPASAEDGARIDEILRDWDVLSVDKEADGLRRLTLTSEWRVEVHDRAVLQTLEVLRRRVDDPKTGIPESVVTRQGSERILVQIPGVSRVPDIFRPGFLEFSIVQDSDLTEELLRARHADGLPEGTRIAFERDAETQRVLRAYLVDENAPITGALLADARVGFDSRRSEWLVNFTWNAEGAKIFGKLTEAHVNEPLAILLDGRVHSSPVIRDRISRQGQISGGFSSEDARDLSIVLRAGALSIPIVVEEERTIGPALGADSIRRGLRASLIGLLFVGAFSMGYYRLSGGYASAALLANLVLLLGIMALFGATLTLPGIAGLVLTVGMAVDANVIIFERIREELRSGKAVRAAIATGFQRARWTILDANITTFITALILYEYGTGPVRGFAVTLSVGILTSVFAALVLTRMFFMIYPGNRNVSELSI